MSHSVGKKAKRSLRGSSQRVERRGSAGVGEGADLLLLVAVCAAGSEAESQAHQGARVWREAQAAQAARVGRDGERRECGRNATQTSASQGVPASASASPPRRSRRRGHGRQGAEVYRAAQTVECRHEELAVGERCPACGRGTLVSVTAGRGDAARRQCATLGRAL